MRRSFRISSSRFRPASIGRTFPPQLQNTTSKGTIMAIVLKTTYRTGLTQACPSDHRFSLSMRTKVADLTQVQTECARLYAVLQASVHNALQNHGSLPLNLNGHGERRHITRALRGGQNRFAWASSRKQRKLLRRFIAKC